MSAQVIEVVGAPAVRRMLRPWIEPSLPQRAKRAVRKGGNILKPPLRAEAKKVSKRMAKAATVQLSARGLVGGKQMPKLMPGEPGVYVGFVHKKAFFSHLVIGGTHDHGPRRAKALVFEGRGGLVVTGRVRGVKANPMVERVSSQYGEQAVAAFRRELESE